MLSLRADLSRNRLLPLIGWAALIAILTSIPGSDLPRLPSLFQTLQGDKFAHAFLYLVLGYLGHRIWIWNRDIEPAAFWTTVIFCVLYAVADELHQTLIPGRSASFYDLLADAFGAFLGVRFRLIRVRRRSVE